MIEKIRISLWDIFTFFMTGVFALIATCIVLAVTAQMPKSEVVVEFLIKLPTTYIIVVAPIVLTLVGLLIEPLANFFERYLGRFIYFWLPKDNQTRKADEVMMEQYIKENGFGDLNGQIEKPFLLCKEYVETKQLSTTFMVFLARYGFYRNCSFILLLSGVVYVITEPNCGAFVWFFASYCVSALLTKRANEFYSYQAPTVYSAFLIDNLNWPAKQLAKDEKLSAETKEN
ncbi:hypothetical protein VT06_13890 [Arsukibacterium sp. MJ3]|uniref:hypothetical protein n=1 Tax=Arsukibacterium sp. MJ3 TaxID=1632859 RepID=UPI0006271478|nr:hypothetical protein [Arsukibacterium sp. MJ3]KKO47981.1 hypothetical protein VT06_13890 [Arsukibacterium sp. MJ3]